MAKTILKVVSTVDSKLSTIPAKDGQLIFVYDKKKIILDNHGVRTVYEQIQTIETEEQRNDLLAPIDSFYFVIETSILWRYTNGHWNQITTSPQEQIDRIATEGAKQVKAVQDKGTEVLQSIPEDFVTQMASKLDKQHGTENAGKIIAVNEEGNAIPLCPNGVRYNSETNNLEYGSDDLPLMEGIKLDDSLTKEGFAADAKVVGDIFDSKQNKLQGADIIVNAVSGSRQLIITDSSEREIQDLNIYGKTEQVQTTGVNLFDEKLLLDFDSENYDKTQSGSGFYYYKFPVSGTVTVSTKNANKNGEYLTVGIKPDGSDKTWLSHGTAAISKYKTLTPEDGNIYLGVNNNLERVKSMIQNTGGIIINEGSAAQPYEPYTGNKPSPSPEYLQEIKNSGKWNEEKQKYEVVVKVTGKNLFDMNKFIDTCNFTKNEDGTFIIDKRVERYDCFIPANTILSIEVLKVGDSTGAAVLELFYEDGKNMYIGFGQVGVKTFLIQKDVVYIKVLAYRKHEYKYIQLEKGNTATPYEPYKEQTLTLTSDRPITKWDRLVEQGGEIGWLYKSKIDALPKTGYRYIETGYFSKGNVFTDSALNTTVTPGSQFFTCFSLANPSSKKGDIAWLYVNKPGTTDLRVRFADESINTAELFEKYMADKDMKILYETAQTEFVPLPQSEQNAIRALRTYYPTTVITADGGELDPDIKVTYRKEI